MPCVKLPAPAPIDFGPISVPGLPTPSFPEQPELCCQLPDIVAMIAAQIGPIPLPPGTLNPAIAQEIATVLEDGLDALLLAIDSVTPDCPRN